jgi:hypothetical protein
MLLFAVFTLHFAILCLGRIVWRKLPLTGRLSDTLYVFWSVVFVTPIPVDLGVGGFWLPIVFYYRNLEEAKSVISWIANDPSAFVMFGFFTAILAYWVSKRLLPFKFAQVGESA